LAGGGWSLGLGLVLVLGFGLVLCSQSCGGNAKASPRDQQRCDCGGGKLASR
jgi:hypothetical protein